MTAKADVLKNTDILTIALWKAGGDTQFVDIEDAYAMCWEMAPQRFAWRTRKDLPALDMLSAVFRSLASSTDFVLREGRHKVRLSSTGLQWIQQHESVIAAFTGTESGKVEYSPNRVLKRLNRFKKDVSFERWLADPEIVPEKWELAAALRCSPDSPSNIWRQRIESTRADAQIADDQEVFRFIDLVMGANPTWFGGN